MVNQLSKEIQRPIHKTEKIHCQHINTLLENHLPKGQNIDLVDIDLEGWDERVVKAYDWERFRPQFVAVELKAQNVREALEHEISYHLRSKDFEMINYCHITAFFVDKKRRRTIK